MNLSLMTKIQNISNLGNTEVETHRYQKENTQKKKKKPNKNNIYCTFLTDLKMFE